MSTVRDVVLRIKVEMQGARGGGAGTPDGLGKEFRQIEKDITPVRRSIQGLSDDLRRAEAQAKKTGDALKFGNGRITGGAGGGGQGGGLGLGSAGKLAGFAPLAMFTAMLGSSFKEYALASIGHSAAGGKGALMRGAGGPIEDLYHRVAGTAYRERNEDYQERDYAIEARRQEGRWGAAHEAQRDRYALDMQRLPISATIRDRLAALQGQKWNIAGVEAKGNTLLNQEHVLARAQDDVSQRFNKFFPNYKSGDQIGVTGSKMSKFQELEKERNSVLTEQKENSADVLRNLKQQLDMHRAIKDNLGQQLSTVREMSMARKQSLTSFGMLDPFQQKSALGVAVAAKEGRTLTKEQMAIGMQVPEIADFLQRQAGSRAVDNQDYQKILGLVGRPGEADRFAQSKEAAGKIQMQPGQMKIDVFLQVDENMLADAIGKSVGDQINRIEVLAKQVADRQGKGEGLAERRVRDHDASFGRSIP